MMKTRQRVALNLTVIILVVSVFAFEAHAADRVKVHRVPVELLSVLENQKQTKAAFASLELSVVQGLDNQIKHFWAELWIHNRGQRPIQTSALIDGLLFVDNDSRHHKIRLSYDDYPSKYINPGTKAVYRFSLKDLTLASMLSNGEIAGIVYALSFSGISFAFAVTDPGINSEYDMSSTTGLFTYWSRNGWAESVDELKQKFDSLPRS